MVETSHPQWQQKATVKATTTYQPVLHEAEVLRLTMALAMLQVAGANSSTMTFELLSLDSSTAASAVSSWVCSSPVATGGGLTAG